MDQLFKFISHDILTSSEIQILSATTKERNSWVVICRGKNRYVEELYLHDPDHNPTSSELLFERPVAKESETCPAVLEQSPHRATSCDAVQNFDGSSVYRSKEVIPVGERKWNDIPAYKTSEGDSLQAEISIYVMRLVRDYDQDERETDGAVHLNSMIPKLRKAFQKSGGRKFSDTDWIEHIYEGSNKVRFQYCTNSKNSFCILVPFKDTLELTGHVAIPKKNGKNSCFIEDVLSTSTLSLDQDTSLEDEKAKKEDRPSSSHLSTRSGTIQTKKNLAMTYQNREKYTITVSGKLLTAPSLTRPQDKGLRFWQTRTDAIIVCSSVAADCIYKLISHQEKRTLSDRTSECLAIEAAATAAAATDTSESASSSTRKLVQRVQRVQREEQGNPTDNPELPSSAESPVEKVEPEF